MLTNTSTMTPGMDVVTWPGSVARGRFPLADVLRG